MFDASHPTYMQDERRYYHYEQLGLIPHLRRRQIVDLGELPIHCELYEYDSHAPTLLFIPGIGTYSELYCELLARLCDEGFNIMAVDLRGHGYSGGIRGQYRVDEVVDDLCQVIDYLEQHFDGPIGLFGCSIGARLGLAAAEREPRIQALLCHTLFLAELPPDLWHSVGWSSLQFSSLFAPFMRVNFRNFVNVEDLLKYNPMGQLADKDPLLVWNYPISTLHSVYSHSSDVLEQSLGIPAAIIIGSNDEVIRLEYIERIRQKSSQAFDLIVIEDGSHMLPFDHIDDTLEASSAWFQQAFNPGPLPDSAR